MKLSARSFTEKDGQVICTWTYEDEYAIYNMPQWDVVVKNNWAMAMKDKRDKEFMALVDENGDLCGYIRLVDKDEYILIGVGLKPDICGKGAGSQLMNMIKKECVSRYGKKLIALEVRAFNKRAIKCYEKAGFIKKETYSMNTPLGNGEFIRMEYR